MMRRISVALALTLVLAVAVSGLAFAMTTDEYVGQAKERIAEAGANITPMELQMRLEMGEEIPVIDIRNHDEYLGGAIPGAINITRDLLPFRISSVIPEKDTVFVVNCKSGGRSSLAVVELMELGYTNVLNLDGGVKGWLDSGYAVETSLGLLVVQ